MALYVRDPQRSCQTSVDPKSECLTRDRADFDGVKVLESLSLADHTLPSTRNR
jgi:hypothetical protein